MSVGLFMRIQPRTELERIRPARGAEWRRDFLIRRSRVWLQGKAHGADYKLQWKIDGEDQNATRTNAQLEDAYIQYPVTGVAVRAGLYDQPFSRERLTSDGKQLAVDRGSVSDVPNTLGLADNAVGLHVLRSCGSTARYGMNPSAGGPATSRSSASTTIQRVTT